MAVVLALVAWCLLSLPLGLLLGAVCAGSNGGERSQADTDVRTEAVRPAAAGGVPQPRHAAEAVPAGAELTEPVGTTA